MRETRWRFAKMARSLSRARCAAIHGVGLLPLV
jgi:hypothetical protein